MDLKKRRTLRAIQRLSQIPADGSEDERLKQIAELATGKLDPSSLEKRQDKDELLRRLNVARGIAPDDSETRKHRGGKDRKHRGGQDRAEL